MPGRSQCRPHLPASSCDGSWASHPGSRSVPRKIRAHFDAAFVAQVSPAELNEGLESLGPPGSVVKLLGLTHVSESALQAVLEIGRDRYSVQLSVDPAGLIAGLLFKPVVDTVPSSWPQADKQLASLAPGVSFLAAKVGPDGACTPVHAVAAGVPRPLASMFKLFVLGALANAVHEHRVAWGDKLTVSAAARVGSSSALQDVANGTKLTVEQLVVDMISVSDNTAADMLLALVGRSAVEDQVQQWSSDASLDVPFLTVSELFTLKYHDFPAMAEHYLSLGLAASEVPCEHGGQGPGERRAARQHAV